MKRKSIAERKGEINYQTDLKKVERARKKIEKKRKVCRLGKENQQKFVLDKITFLNNHF